MINNYTTLVFRIIEILVNPRKTWRIIRDEPQRGSQLVLHYVFPLTLVPAVCGLIGHLAYGSPFFFCLVSTLLFVGIMVGSTWVIAKVANALAPSFGTVRNENAAFKVACYTSTSVWLAGVLLLFPSLAILVAVIGFGYGVFLLYLGFQILMGTPEEKVWGFALATTGLWFAMVLVAWLVVLQVSGIVSPLSR